MKENINNYHETNVIFESPTVYTPSQKQNGFYQELEILVNRHLRYLQSVERIKSVDLSWRYLFFKRVMDLFVGIAGLILFSPMFLFIAILIKLDSSGPVFFIQDRVGKNGKLFKIYKFRTMVYNAEQNTGPVWAIENDPRLTFIGKILRNTKLDEFPQFINIIKGEMSLVGPRPERPIFVNEFIKYIPGYNVRFLVTPGITGIAQLRNGYDRDALNLIRKLRYEVIYIKKMNPSLDLALLLETFTSFIRGRF
jgi:lipopolysaccharide/colanic/teichoic acid biosynthesis glycosyltransferase